MSKASLEHVNLTVRDPARTAALMAGLFGWHIRWQGAAADGGFTIHVGTDDEYLALYTQPEITYDADQFIKGRPLNHVGIVVDDLAQVEAAVRAAGLKPFGHGDYEPGHRFYFYDHDGTEYEVVSYG